MNSPSRIGGQPLCILYYLGSNVWWIVNSFTNRWLVSGSIYLTTLVKVNIFKKSSSQFEKEMKFMQTLFKDVKHFDVFCGLYVIMGALGQLHGVHQHRKHIWEWANNLKRLYSYYREHHQKRTDSRRDSPAAQHCKEQWYVRTDCLSY